jgi:2-polyprenyl-6-methoxyphenol hydroxylase-like FAD-dependent oxidoreductase
MSENRHVEIAGAGFAGLTAAAAFARRGWSVRVHERADELRTAGAGIYIYENGLRIFETLGIYEMVIRDAYPAYKREMRGDNNKVLLRISWENGGPGRVFSIVRQRCIDALAHAARQAGAEIVTSSEVVGVSPDGEIEIAGGHVHKSDLVIVADGVNSRLRDSLDLIAERRTLVDGAIRMLVERTEEERISEEGRKYIEMWSGTHRILYTPCSDSELYLAFTMLNDDAEATHLPLNKDAWKRWFPQMEGVIERVGDQGHWDAFQYIRLRKWSKGCVAVIGDAAHALPPNIGQGGGCAMMNALSLATILSEYTDLEAGLADWERRERHVTEHAQKISLWISIPTTWHPTWRAWAFTLAGHSAWFAGQRNRTALHVPTGTTDTNLYK